MSEGRGSVEYVLGFTNREMTDDIQARSDEQGAIERGTRAPQAPAETDSCRDINRRRQEVPGARYKRSRMNLGSVGEHKIKHAREIGDCTHDQGGASNLFSRFARHRYAALHHQGGQKQNTQQGATGKPGQGNLAAAGVRDQHASIKGHAGG